MPPSPLKSVIQDIIRTSGIKCNHTEAGIRAQGYPLYPNWAPNLRRIVALNQASIAISTRQLDE